MTASESFKTEIYEASVEEMFELSMQTAKEIAAAQKRYDRIVAKANGGLFLGLFVGQVLRAQVQTLRTENIVMNKSTEETWQAIRPLDVIPTQGDNILFTTDVIDHQTEELLHSVVPNAHIAANYSQLSKELTSEIINYCGKIIEPKQAGNQVHIKFWYDLSPETS